MRVFLCLHLICHASKNDRPQRHRDKTKMTPTETKAKKPRIVGMTKNDLALAYALDGLDGIAKILGQNKLPRLLAKKVSAELSAKGKAHDDFCALYLAASSRGAPKMQPVAAGDSRQYSVQVTKAGKKYVHVPLDLLPVGKGSKVTMSFSTDAVVVSAG